MTCSGRARWLTAAALLAAALPAVGGPEGRVLSQCILERWTYRDGLPHNVVHRLLATRSGYLWIGTQEGLVRFDGVRFKVFAHLDTPGLAGNEITALREDERGVLWVGTLNGLSRLASDTFEEVSLGSEAAVSDLAADGAGGAWVTMEAGGVRHVRADLRVERLDGLPDQPFTAITQSRSGLWIGGTGGVYRLVEGRLDLLGAAGLPSGKVTRIAETRDGTIWVGTTSGLARRGPGASRFEEVALSGAPSVQALLEDREGALWVGTEGGPLLRIAGGRTEPLMGTTGPSDVHALDEDADGDLWAGTETGGLYRLRWGPAVTVAREEGLSADVVWTVREGRGGVVWVGSDGGLDRLTGGRPEPVHAAELRGASLAALFEDRAGDLWVGTNNAGLLRFGPGRTVRYGSESGLGSTMPRAIHQDARGTIWVGTSHGLYRMTGEQFRALPNDPALPGDKINTIEELLDGSLWVGTTTGLARVEGDRLVPATPAGAPVRGDVTALHADPDGAIWIGTVGEGLTRVAGGKVQRWTRRQGLYEDTILAILDDAAGHLWVSGNHGIARLDRAQLSQVAAGGLAAVAPLVLGTADGMRERECNGGVEPSAWRSTDGRLWFATIRGVVIVDPNRVEASPRATPVVLEELVVDGHPLPFSGDVRLAPGTRRVDLRYTGLALAAAERIRFRHRLVGLDDAFVDAGGERVAHFTNLGPGRYVFEVVAASPSGAWGRPASLTFRIEPHFWQTAWFSAAVAAGLLAVALAAHLTRIGALRRREALLAARVDEEMGKVKILTGLLPTCAWCKRIRDEDGRWQRFDAYVSSHANVQFTHGMCPECFASHGGDEDHE